MLICTVSISPQHAQENPGSVSHDNKVLRYSIGIDLDHDKYARTYRVEPLYFLKLLFLSYPIVERLAGYDSCVDEGLSILRGMY